MNTDNTLDEAVLDQLYRLGKGTGALVCSVVEAFQRSLPVYMEQLRNGVANSDANAIRMASHALKSSAANLGATDFSAQCEIIEHQSRDGNLSNSEVELARLENLLDPLNLALDNEHQTATARQAA